MKVLLSIKPIFAEQIFSGMKKYEFRRTIFKDQNVRTVVVYASSPIKQVIGEFEVEEVICAKIPTLWRRTYRNAGLSKQEFCQYFTGKDKGYAIKIRKTRKYKKPLSLSRDLKVAPPQSFVYL